MIIEGSKVRCLERDVFPDILKCDILLFGHFTIDHSIIVISKPVGAPKASIFITKTLPWETFRAQNVQMLYRLPCLHLMSIILKCPLRPFFSDILLLIIQLSHFKMSAQTSLFGHCPTPISVTYDEF